MSSQLCRKTITCLPVTTKRKAQPPPPRGVWCPTPGIPILWRLRQEVSKLGANLAIIERPCLKNKQTNKQTNKQNQEKKSMSPGKVRLLQQVRSLLLNSL
jgi:hypothetical protein